MKNSSSWGTFPFKDFLLFTVFILYLASLIKCANGNVNITDSSIVIPDANFLEEESEVPSNPSGTDYISPDNHSCQNHVDMFKSFNMFPKHCFYLLTSPNGTLDFPPAQYLGTDLQENIDACLWIICANSDQQIIRLEWEDSSIANSPCAKYRIRVVSEFTPNQDGSLDVDYGGLDSYCLNQLPSPTTSSGSALAVLYSDTGSVTSQSHRHHVIDYSFRARYWTVDNNRDCDQSLNGESGYITTPGYPSSHVFSHPCTWKITAQFGYQIRLNLSELSFSQVGCQYGYMELRSGKTSSSTLSDRFCGGDIISPMFVSDAHHLWLQYFSVMPRNALRIEWNAKSKGCGRNITGTSGIISSLGYPDGQHFMPICTWTVQVNDGHVVRIEFVDVNLVYTVIGDEDCHEASIQIYDGSLNGPSLAKICRQRQHKFLLSQLNRVVIVYRNMPVGEAKGRRFLLRFVAVCEQVFTGHEGYIESTNYPNPYPNDLTCLWKIAAWQGNSVNIEILDFDIRDCVAIMLPKFSMDTLKITEWDRNSANGMSKTAELCQTNSSREYNSTYDTVTISFTTDRILNGRGFRLKWEQRGCAKYMLVSSIQQNITSPKFPLSYPVDQECIWWVRSDKGTTISLSIHEYEIEWDVSCKFDAIEVGDGVDETFPLLAKLCGRRSVPTLVVSTKNHMFIKFKSDSTVAFRGFTASIMQLKNSERYIRVFGSEGYIHSPKWPNAYEHNLDLNWVLSTTSYSALIINITDFSLEDQYHCSGDMLWIYNRRSGETLFRRCGYVSDWLIRTKTSAIGISFVPDKSISLTGFRLKYTSECSYDIEDESGVISTPSIIRGSAETISCNWTFLPTRELHTESRMLLIFTDIEWTSSTDGFSCRDDYVLVTSHSSNSSSESGLVLYEACCGRLPSPLLSTGDTLVFNVSGQIQTNAVFVRVPAGCFTPQTMELFPNINITDDAFNVNNSECFWKVDHEGGKKVYITTQNYNSSAHGKECDSGFVKIYTDGFYLDLIGSYCRSPIPTNLSVWEQYWIVYVSESDGRDQVMGTESATRKVSSILTSNANGSMTQRQIPGDLILVMIMLLGSVQMI